MLSKLLSILLETILPVILIAGAGYVLQRRLDLDVRSISRASLYFFSPCLGFSAMAQAHITPAELWHMAVVVIGVMGIMLGAGYLLSIAWRLDRGRRSALLVSVAFVNCGNFGLSVALFAFGDLGLEKATLYFVISAVFTHSVGAFLAAQGGNAGTLKESIANTLRLPLIYATLLGLLVNLARIPVPEPILRATDLAGRAAVPVLLTVLGMQMVQLRVGQDLGVLMAGTFLRLIVGPAAAFAIASLLGMTGISWQVAILQSAMPSAVNSVVLCTEFGSAPELASGLVFTTTVASIVTLTLLLALIA